MLVCRPAWRCWATGAADAGADVAPRARAEAAEAVPQPHAEAARRADEEIRRRQSRSSQALASTALALLTAPTLSQFTPIEAVMPSCLGRRSRRWRRATPWKGVVAGSL
ncbi:MAG: hypothetical protein U1F68_00260 [Gammaproteobacteria bacterium]